MHNKIGKIAIYNRVGNESQLIGSEASTTLDKLKEAYHKNMLANKAEHDVAAMMGSLGVSPKQMTMYNESIRLIKEYEHKRKWNDMNKYKCVHCTKNYKPKDEIVIMNGNLSETVHSDCHYDYLMRGHLNDYVNLEMLKEIIEEDRVKEKPQWRNSRMN